MQTLIFATNNAHKLEEVQAALGSGFTLLTLNDIGIESDPDETGTTLEDNALLKARALYQKINRNCFADDTGLEIEALNGEPGVNSSHYAGHPRNNEENVALVIQKLNGETNRKARFRTVIALIIDDEEHLFEGVVNGEIAIELKGGGGFGYDPVFYPEGLDRTFAEMSLAEKNQHSHRARALAKMAAYLKTDS